MTGHTQGRILIGGRRAGFKGDLPGILEEAILAMEAAQPIYLAGGFGGMTWGIAALVVICGFVSDFTGRQSHVFYPAIAPAAAPDRYAAMAQQLRLLPIWIFHGDADENVSVEESRHMASALQVLSANVRYTELAGVDHSAWDPAYDNAEMLAWLLAQRRH